MPTERSRSWRPCSGVPRGLLRGTQRWDASPLACVFHIWQKPAEKTARGQVRVHISARKVHTKLRRQKGKGPRPLGGDSQLAGWRHRAFWLGGRVSPFKTNWRPCTHAGSSWGWKEEIRLALERSGAIALITRQKEASLLS